jgi:hypothetical protein
VLVLALLLALAPALPQALRVESVYGSFVHDGTGTLAQDAGLREVAANLPRQLLLHFSAPLAAFNRGAYGLVASWFQALGVDPQDSRLTYQGAPWNAAVARLPTRANLAFAGAFWQLLPLFIALAWVWRRTGKGPEARLLTLLSLVGWVGMLACLKWQPFGARLQLPFFALAAPWVGLAMEGHPKTALLGCLLFAANAGSLLWRDEGLAWHGSDPRRSLSFESRYFLQAPAVEGSLRSAAGFLAAHPCERLGLDFDGFSLEYPVFVLLKGRDLTGPPRIEAVPSGADAPRFVAPPGSAPFAPDAVLRIHPGELLPQPPALAGPWTLAWTDPVGGRMRIWRRAKTP